MNQLQQQLVGQQRSTVQQLLVVLFQGHQQLHLLVLVQQLVKLMVNIILNLIIVHITLVLNKQQAQCGEDAQELVTKQRLKLYGEDAQELVTKHQQ